MRASLLEDGARETGHFLRGSFHAKGWSFEITDLTMDLRPDISHRVISTVMRVRQSVYVPVTVVWLG